MGHLRGRDGTSPLPPEHAYKGPLLLAVSYSSGANMSENRPPIPEPIKRIVRQRCGFGCIFCGAPIYDYEHIEEYNKVREHQADNITLLCPNHHREKTAGRLPANIVKERNVAPRNKSKPYTAYHELFFRGQKFGFRLGGMWFEGL